MISDFASETRVFCPVGKAAGLAVEEIGEIELFAEPCDALGEIGHAVEHAEHGQILPDREPPRHADIGAFEIHPLQDTIALLRHLARRAR